MFYKEYLEKNAFVKGFDTDEETKLILEYQKTKNPIILGRLQMMMEGVIRNAINKSPTYGLPDNSLYQKSLMFFKQAIETYDSSAGAKPATYVTNMIVFGFQKDNAKYKDETRMRAQLADLSVNKHLAETKLDLLGELTPDMTEDQRYSKIKKTMDAMHFGGKKTDVKFLKRIDNQKRRTLFGGAMLGGDEGENITLEDVLNTGVESASDMLEREYAQERLKRALLTLSPLERGVVEDRLGIGGRKKETSWRNVMLNNNLTTPYEAEKIFRLAREKLKKEIEI